MAGFKDIIGNDLVKGQFAGAISHEKLSHAYIMLGEKGIGKKTIAEALCLDLFCEEKDAEGHACLHCKSCKQIMTKNHPDVIYVTHEKPDSISVDEIRAQVNDTVSIKPYQAKYKFYIIEDAEKMTVQAQNALLKTLEEPPEYAVLLLLANEEKGLLETVFSRAMKVKLKPCTDSQIRQYLREHYGAEDERADLSVAFARGNLGKAIYLLTSEEFSVWYHRTIKICRNVKRMDGAEIVQEVKELLSECDSIQEALDLIQLWYRDLLMYKVTKDMNGLVFSEERKALMDLASLSSYEGIEEIMDAIETCRIRLKANVNAELALELLFLNMREK